MAIGTFGVVTNINLSKLSEIMAEQGAVPTKIMGEKGAVYPPLYEKLVPIVLGIIVVALIVVVLIIVGVALGLFPGSG